MRKRTKILIISFVSIIVTILLYIAYEPIVYESQLLILGNCDIEISNSENGERTKTHSVVLLGNHREFNIYDINESDIKISEWRKKFVLEYYPNAIFKPTVTIYTANKEELNSNDYLEIVNDLREKIDM